MENDYPELSKEIQGIIFHWLLDRYVDYVINQNFQLTISGARKHAGKARTITIYTPYV